MKTSQLQSMLCRNAQAITLLTATMRDDKRLIADAQYEASRKQLRNSIQRLRVQIKKLADIQKAIKFDLQAVKLARLHTVGRRRSKHGKDDQRYTDWLAKDEGIGGAGPLNFGGAVVYPVGNTCDCG
jgi:hypothetical protein